MYAGGGGGRGWWAVAKQGRKRMDGGEGGHLPACVRTSGKDLGGVPTYSNTLGGSSKLSEEPNMLLGRPPPLRACNASMPIE